MIKFIGQLPNKCVVAFSGGIDSVVVADFLLGGKKNIELAFFHHGTEASAEAEQFVTQFASERNLPLKIGRIDRPRKKDESPEEFWRTERYKFLDSFSLPVVTAHHLDDAVETWIFNCLHGNPRVIPYRRGNVIRPFLVTPKSQFFSWANRKNLVWADDMSNLDMRYSRNRIRHALVPEALKINPGLHTTVRKMYITCGD